MNPPVTEQLPENTRTNRNTQPTVSANEMVNPPAQVNPPVPTANTNDGTRTNNLIRNVAQGTQGFIASESESARQRDELAGLLGQQTFDAAGQRQQLTDQFGVTGNLSRLQDIQTQLAQRNTESQLAQSRIAASAGQTLAQGGREITQEQREASIRDAGLAAEASVLQGNIETASTLINNAMQDFYSDRQLMNQNMIQQLEYFSGIAEGETAQLLKQEQRQYEEDQLNISRALTSVDAAVATGIASPQDVQTMTSLSGDPTAQKQYADEIIARAARQEYNQRQAEINARLSAKGVSSPERANFGTSDNPIWRQWNAETGTWEEISGIDGVFDENNQAELQAKTEHTKEVIRSIDKIRDYKLGLRASTGIVQSPVATGISTPSPLGPLAGAPLNIIAAGNQKKDLLSELSFLVNDATFSEMRRLKEQGVTFGALTEGERKAIGRASDALFSALEVDDSGMVVGIGTSEQNFNRILSDFEQKILRYQEETNKLLSGMTDEDEALIDSQ